ncbi:MAG: WYL domain-containing protein [Anaerolineales bacterium]|nr:WYL domain-containing protein [Anaerolineales bacterium]MCB8951027.1 WYL domain-containing protein [Ardenticatenales bacterium]
MFAEQKLSDIPLVVLDTETTGLRPELGHRVVEVAAVRLENWQKVEEVSQLINPERPMDPEASKVNGIRDEDLLGQPVFGLLQPRLMEIMDGALLVAHNAAFDAGFLGMEFYIAGIHASPATLPNPWLCTLQLARRHFFFGRNNLGHIASKLGVRVGRAHRALSDVYTTAAVLKEMARLLAQRRLDTVGDLLHAQGGPIFAPPPPRFSLPASIETAMVECRQLNIIYLDQYQRTERTITPLYPTQYEGVTYLVAFCHLRQAQRTFRLDRIQSAEIRNGN